jgi:hypothetical protein
MMHVVGFGDDGSDPRMRSLLSDGQLRFNTADWHTLGYFLILAPLFDYFARRDSELEIFSMHVAFTLDQRDLNECVAILRSCQGKLVEYPARWRPDLGEERTGMGAEQVAIPIRPLLFRERALAIVDKLLRLAQEAMASGRPVLYGNGAYYRRLCNIRGVYYS